MAPRQHVERHRFHGFRERDSILAAAQRHRGRFQHIGARIAHAIDAMPEPHQPLAARQCRLQPRPDIVVGRDRIEHVEHRAGRPAMQRSLERAQPPDDRGEWAGTRRGDHPRGEGRRVEAMIGDGHEIRVEGVHMRR